MVDYGAEKIGASTLLVITSEMILGSSLHLILNLDTQGAPASLICSVQLLQGL